MSNILQLFIQFFHIGVFSFGGGYATIPFLYDIAEKFNWYTTTQLTNMISISSITPGPIGINMATFAGFTTMGILGAIIATFSIVLPSFIITTCVYKIIDRFKANQCVTGAIRALRPAGCALLSAVGIKLIFTSNLHLIGAITLLIFIFSGFKKKMDPIFYLGISAVIGIALGTFNLIGV